LKYNIIVFCGTLLGLMYEINELHLINKINNFSKINLSTFIFLVLFIKICKKNMKEIYNEGYM